MTRRLTKEQERLKDVCSYCGDALLRDAKEIRRSLEEIEALMRVQAKARGLELPPRRK